MKVLVTGGAGYVGSVLIHYLLMNGHTVRCVDLGLFGFGSLESIKDKIEIIASDIYRADRDMVCGCDAIINLAAFSNDPMSDKYSVANRSVNARGVMFLAGVAARYGVPKFIQASSASIYDGLDDTILLTENAKVKPHRGYALSKYEAEQHLFSSKIKQSYALRKGTLFGLSPRMRYDLIVHTMLKSVLQHNHIRCSGGGVQWRPLVSVCDAARAYIKLLEKDGECGIYNLVEDNYQVLNVAGIISKTLGNNSYCKPNVIIDGETKPDRSYSIDGNKLLKKFGFKPTTPIAPEVKRIFVKMNLLDIDNPKYYNIKWVDMVLQMQSTIGNLEFRDIFY